MLQLPQELTQTTASASLRDLIAALANDGPDVVVDASGLSRFDSTALAVLLALRREALRLRKSFTLQGLPQRLGDLARLYGIADLLPSQA